MSILVGGPRYIDTWSVTVKPGSMEAVERRMTDAVAFGTMTACLGAIDRQDNRYIIETTANGLLGVLGAVGDDLVSVTRWQTA